MLPILLIKMTTIKITTNYFAPIESELVLKSRNVIPKRLQENGFTFNYDSAEKTFENLLQKN